ncbi:unnamed protein product [Auanema sp. JU1783]|nr:unnamed protein product [Auanema sp. JU1783]
MLRFTFFLAASLLLTIPSTQADIFDGISGVASDVGDFFTKQFNSAKDLFAGDQNELEKNINRLKDLLTALKEKAKALEPLASDAQKKTLAKVDEYLGQIDEFQETVKTEGKESFEANKTKWQEMVTKIFETGGLQDVMKLLNVKSAGQFSLVIAACVPVMMALLR